MIPIRFKGTRVVANLKEFGRANAFEERLPLMASAYNISAEIKDYFLAPVLMFHSNVPNRNGYVFPTESLTEWITPRMAPAYETWRYAPLHIEHKAENPLDAIGVIADVAIKKESGFGKNAIYKVIALAAVDRTKNKDRARKIEAGEYNSWSMGCDASRIYCSYCGKDQAYEKDGAFVGGCDHLNPESPVIFYERNGKIVCRAASGLSGVELSSVGTPAFAMAVNNISSIKAY
jgi:hypothetical protein